MWYVYLLINENNNDNNNNKQKIVVIASDDVIFATNLSFSFRPIAPFQSCGKLAAARQWTMADASPQFALLRNSQWRKEDIRYMFNIPIFINVYSHMHSMLFL